MSNQKPIFVLNVGAQKSGTSWLRGTLRRLDHANLGFTKEYHVWDHSIPKEILGHDFTRPPLKNEAPEETLRRMMQQDGVHYFNYFRSLISPTLRLTGDFSPSYCLLPGHELQSLVTKLGYSGFDVVVVYLMRDPVERCWSAFRSYNRDRNQDLPTDGLSQAFREFYQARPATERTRYDRIIPKLLRLDSKNKIFRREAKVTVVIEGYEHLMQGGVETLSKALQVEPNSLINEQVFNGSPSHSLPLADQAACAAHFAEAYAYCRTHYPQIAQHWKSLA